MTPLPLLVLEAGSGTKFLTNSANPILWTLFGSHKEFGGASFSLFLEIMALRMATSYEPQVAQVNEELALESSLDLTLT
jgi:hypothetical protein